MYLWLLYRCKDELKNRREINDDKETNSINGANDSSFNIDLENSTENNSLSSYAKCLAMLWEPYKNEFWYWEIIESYRRIILTSFISIINPGSSFQSIAALTFSLFFYKLYSHYAPYARRSDNVLSDIGQFQVFWTFFISLIINNSLLGNTWKYELDIILITTNLFIAILTVFFTITDLNLLKRIPAISITSITSILDSSNGTDEGGEIHFTSLRDTDDPELLYNSMKIKSDAYNEQIRMMALSPDREDIYDFEMDDFPDHDDDNDDNNDHNNFTMRSERSIRFKTPFN